MSDDDRRKGLRFEVFQGQDHMWEWNFVGAGDEVYARSPFSFVDEKAARSHIARVKRKMGNCGRSKVVTLDTAEADQLRSAV